MKAACAEELGFHEPLFKHGEFEDLVRLSKSTLIGKSKCGPDADFQADASLTIIGERHNDKNSTNNKNRLLKEAAAGKVVLGLEVNASKEAVQNMASRHGVVLGDNSQVFGFDDAFARGIVSLMRLSWLLNIKYKIYRHSNSSFYSKPIFESLRNELIAEIQYGPFTREAWKSVRGSWESSHGLSSFCETPSPFCRRAHENSRLSFNSVVYSIEQDGRFPQDLRTRPFPGRLLSIEEALDLSGLAALNEIIDVLAQHYIALSKDPQLRRSLQIPADFERLTLDLELLQLVWNPVEKMKLQSRSTDTLPNFPHWRRILSRKYCQS